MPTLGIRERRFKLGGPYLSELTTGYIGVQCHLVLGPIQRLNSDVQVGKGQGLSLQVVGGDGGHKRDVHPNFAPNIHDEGAPRRSVGEIGLVHRFGGIGWGPHPCVSRAIDTDESDPSRDVLTAQGLVKAATREYAKELMVYLQN